MKSNYAIFDESGNFSRFEDLDPAVLPPIPLAADGHPRAVPLPPQPQEAGKAYTPARDGSWVERDADPEPVPESVSPAQLREALIDAGISLESITTALQSIPDAKAKAKALTRWEYATAIERGHPLITQMAGALKLTPAQVDGIFSAASKL